MGRRVGRKVLAYGGLALISVACLDRGQTDSAEVVPCPTGDSMLDHPRVRKALKTALLDSAFIDSVTSKRRERVVVFYRDTSDRSPTDTSKRPLSDTLAIVVYWPPMQAGTTPCNGAAGFANAQDVWVLVAFSHSHPFSSGTSTASADIEPANCGPKHSGHEYTPGPSDEDWIIGQDRRVPGYIIGRDIVNRFDGSDP